MAESRSRNEPRVVGVDSEEADELLDALSSDTARRVITYLNDEHATPSEIADSLDTSVQNVRYHLQNLEEAGLIETTDTKYSSKGREMKVYAPSENPIVIFPRTRETSGLKKAITRFTGGAAILAVTGFLIDTVVNFGGTTGSPVDLQDSQQAGAPVETDGGGGDGTMDAGVRTVQGEPNVTYTSEINQTELLETANRVNESGELNQTALNNLRDQINETATQITRLKAQNQELTQERVQLQERIQLQSQAVNQTADAETQKQAVETLINLSPGTLFFIGGTVVLLVAVTWWYFNRWKL